MSVCNKKTISYFDSNFQKCSKLPKLLETFELVGQKIHLFFLNLNVFLKKVYANASDVFLTHD